MITNYKKYGLRLSCLAATVVSCAAKASLPKLPLLTVVVLIASPRFGPLDDASLGASPQFMSGTLDDSLLRNELL